MIVTAAFVFDYIQGVQRITIVPICVGFRHTHHLSVLFKIRSPKPGNEVHARTLDLLHYDPRIHKSRTT
jgi:hypothetical protein